ncbi:MAG: S-methyl-5-thioribose-1-phosphate isomerase [Anaerolineaceae bacterium]|nr:S-methyl-5-thioribose-1-phosphate isomerase [Anaerolineaceae bacterium]
MRSIEWNQTSSKVQAIDQSLLPGEFKVIEFENADEIRGAIRSMVIRGAPVIGVAAFHAMALKAREIDTHDLKTFKEKMAQFAAFLKMARPTAVNLTWATQNALDFVRDFEGSTDALQHLIFELAERKAEEDVATNMAISRFGAELINDGDRIVHHCNTGALATVDYGTALGCIRMAHEQGKRVHVYVDETRPRLQGSRLTAWELEQYKIPYEIITDSSSGYLMRLGKVAKVLFGADRVALNGDVVNKIGTYMLALAAYDNGIPAYAAFPLSSLDFNCPNGDSVVIEERSGEEVLSLQQNGQIVAPANAKAVNYAFDVTPHRLLDALITDKGVLYPPFFRDISVLGNAGRSE